MNDISSATGKRFNNWTRTQFAKDVLEELSVLTRQPIAKEEGSLELYSKMSKVSEPLIDGGQGVSIFVHPSVAFAYAMSDAKFFARISFWLTNHEKYGTVNPHILQWTREEFERGLEMNRDDIKDLYC